MRQMDSKQIRKANLLYWADKLGRDKLAAKLGYEDTNYLNQLLTLHSKIGDRSARKFEASLSLEPGWLDIPHTDLWADSTAIPETIAKAALKRKIDLLADTTIEALDRMVDELIRSGRKDDN